MIEIPYSVEKRADSGLTNPALGMWLFLASEVMLFASLFSAYALLRLGGGHWPAGNERLHPALGGLNTLILIGSSLVLLKAAAKLAAPKVERPTARWWLLAAIVLAAVFISIKLLEYREVVAEGFAPSTDVFTALYFTLTGVHLVHLIGGVMVAAWLAGPGFGDLEDQPRRLRQRAELLGWYWHFVDAIWIVLFILLYLL